MKRSFINQTRHDEKILELAKRYLSLGYRVFADARGWDAPDAINGFRPDLLLIKGNSGVIIEVETTDSLPHDRLQVQAFDKFAKFVRNVKFKLILI
ncbi:MAG TPA: hypothetical protein VGQ81_08110 [Acidobacteriota bacterium]|nr:hypothetical protein [Acidobacteriota bacterium]